VQELLLFAAVGFTAQLIDGALGMAYGVVSSTVLLSLGVPPAAASASVHSAKLFTGAASALSHLRFGNVCLKVFAPLAIGGVVGGIVGGLVLTSIDGATIKPWVVGWLGLMGLVILWRACKGSNGVVSRFRGSLPLGVVGGFLDAMGGGGWGPTVTTTLVTVGTPPRQAVGSSNAAEFFVAAAVSTTFFVALVTGHWREVESLQEHALAAFGLVLGGVVAAPLAGWITRFVPARALTWAVGVLIVGLAGWQLLGA
jgi:uncharacterized membrane protein YfcA